MRVARHPPFPQFSSGVADRGSTLGPSPCFSTAVMLTTQQRRGGTSSLLRSARAGLVAGLCAGLAVVCTGAAAQAPNEYTVKAAFLYNFALYTEWPPEAFRAPETPLNICVLAADQSEDVLKAALPGRRVKGREVVVRQLDGTGGVAGCHVLFMSASQTRRLGEVLEMIGSQPVLTVCDSAAAAERGCAIAFIVADSRVGFDINTASAAKARVVISSRVLALARKRLTATRSGS
jgi:hypothetical protein